MTNVDITIPNGVRVIGFDHEAMLNQLKALGVSDPEERIALSHRVYNDFVSAATNLEPGFKLISPFIAYDSDHPDWRPESQQALVAQIVCLKEENERLTKQAKWLTGDFFVHTLCTLYESGVGHGLKEDGHKYKADFNPCGYDHPAHQAFELGKQQGREMKEKQAEAENAEAEIKTP